eukprot:tig00000981_g5878.t1
MARQPTPGHGDEHGGQLDPIRSSPTGPVGKCGVCTKKKSMRELSSLDSGIEQNLRRRWGALYKSRGSKICTVCKADICAWAVSAKANSPFKDVNERARAGQARRERDKRFANTIDEDLETFRNGLDIGSPPNPEALPEAHDRRRREPAPSQPAQVRLPEDVRSWSQEDVAAFLNNLRLTQYRDKFAEQAIDGDLLLEIREKHLKEEFQIRDSFHVKKLVKAIENLRDKCPPAPPPANGQIFRFDEDHDVVQRPTDRPTDKLIGANAMWKINFKEIALGERIGSGSFGEVRVGTWKGLEVAVKILKDQDLNEEMTNTFSSEVSLMRKLSHPNVVQLLGACCEPPNLAIVTPLHRKGSLFRVLHRVRIDLSWHRRVCMAIDVALGMTYLHSMRVCHRDLKSANCLVDKHNAVRVGDFGFSRVKTTTMDKFQTQAGTYAYMAPEVLRNEPYNESADVFSFGVVLWELLKREEPFHWMSPYAIPFFISSGNRLPVPDENPEQLAAFGSYRELLLSCWHEEPAARPSFEVILERLKQIASEIKRAAAAAAGGPPSPAAAAAIPAQHPAVAHGRTPSSAALNGLQPAIPGAGFEFPAPPADAPAAAAAALAPHANGANGARSVRAAPQEGGAG